MGSGISYLLDGIIIAMLTLLIGGVAWAGRRVVSRQDEQGKSIDNLDNRLTVVETNQAWTMETTGRATRNTVKIARKVGVAENDIEKTVQKPRARKVSNA